MPEPTAEDRERAEKLVRTGSPDVVGLFARALADERERCLAIAERVYKREEEAYLHDGGPRQSRTATMEICLGIRALGAETKEQP